MTKFFNEYTIKLDIKEQQPNLPIKIVQNDSAFLNIELYDAGKKVDLKEGDQFTVSTINEKTGAKHSGIAKYDGKQFIVYKLRKADMSEAGTYEARFASYKGRHRVSSLKFRYTVYEDLEYIGSNSEDELTLLQELFLNVEEKGNVAQRQGEYAEDRGDYANAAGDFANDAATSNLMNWKNYVKTLADRNREYANPENGDVVFVIDENKVYRYDGIDAMDWEAIQGWDTTVIKQLYAVKEDKTVVAQLRKEFDALTLGGRNLISQYDYTSSPSYNTIEKLSETFQTGLPVFKVTTKAAGTPPLYLHEPAKKVSVLPNQHIVASVWVKTDSVTPLASSIKLYDTANSKVLANTSVEATKAEGWTRYATTYENTTGKELQVSFYAYPENKVGSVIYYTSAKVEHGNRMSEWTPSFEDIAASVKAVDTKVDNYVSKNDKRVTAIETELNTNVVKKKVYDSFMQENTKKLAEITQSANGIKSEVSKKVGASEVKSIINQTAENVRIKASKIDFDGATVFKNTGGKADPNAFVAIKDGKLTIKGYYKRQWRDGIKRNRVQQAQFVNGMLRITDPQGDFIDSNNPKGYDYTQDGSTIRSLYYSSDGISTYVDGGGKSITGKVVSSGTLEFFSHAYSVSRGVTLYSQGGVVALQATTNSVHIHGSSSVYNRSRKAHVILAPHEEVRNGQNRFTFGVATNLTGTMVYGDLSKKIGTGFRFSKSTRDSTIYGIDATGSASSKITLNIGKVKADTITTRNGKHKVYFNGTGGGTLTNSSALQADGIRSNSSNFYIGVAGELRVTNKRGYNSGKSIGYLPVKASKFTPVSSRKFKSNIKDIEIDSLKELKNAKIRQYNLNSDLERGYDKIKYGFILEDVNELFREGDAIDLYTMASVNWDATQKILQKVEKQDNIIKTQQKEIEKLKSQMADLMAAIGEMQHSLK